MELSVEVGLPGHRVAGAKLVEGVLKSQVLKESNPDYASEVWHCEQRIIVATAAVTRKRAQESSLVVEAVEMATKPIIKAMLREFGYGPSSLGHQRAGWGACSEEHIANRTTMGYDKQTMNRWQATVRPIVSPRPRSLPKQQR
ncbi:hypothetical protein B296_00051695 [Ensete ventricosum]|uniref:Uncharacterized protein n=1 Tax=Ensete ventricosum TaxID=4639 RepID=A0A426X0P6_ENSVE|nr:hypothetical protein B296_00051695 [Ensete ventricosum]